MTAKNILSFNVPEQGLESPEMWNLIFLSGPITEETAAAICSRLLSIDFLNKSNGKIEPINLIINSPGGDLTAAWQICDIMDFISTPIHTVGLGQICSAALIILMNGTERRITDRTAIMSHEYSWGTEGNHDQLIATTKEFNNIIKRMLTHYKECTGLPESTIKKDLLNGSDCWLTPKMAKKFNIIDEIVVSSKTKRLKKIEKCLKNEEKEEDEKDG
jgi:ATP-dependent Clp protease, protease subunit